MEQSVKKKKAISVGKAFESDFRKSCQGIESISVDRMNDITGSGGRRFKGAANIADFVIYKYPYQVYLELKTTSSSRFPFSRLTDDQFFGMLRKSTINGVIAGVLVHFTEDEETWFLPIEMVQVAVETAESKSIPIGEFRSYGVKLPGEKKRTRYKYDIERFLEGLYNVKNIEE